MARHSLPRYFVRHADTLDAAAPELSAAPLHLIDSFFIGNRHLEEREWLVAVDELGNLRGKLRVAFRILAKRTRL